MQPPQTTCYLGATLGRHELCPETLCAYWDVAVGGTMERLRAPRRSPRT